MITAWVVTIVVEAVAVEAWVFEVDVVVTVEVNEDPSADVGVG